MSRCGTTLSGGRRPLLLGTPHSEPSQHRTDSTGRHLCLPSARTIRQQQQQQRLQPEHIPAMPPAQLGAPVPARCEPSGHTRSAFRANVQLSGVIRTAQGLHPALIKHPELSRARSPPAAQCPRSFSERNPHASARAPPPGGAAWRCCLLACPAAASGRCITFMAAASVGAIVVPTNSLWNAAELEYGAWTTALSWDLSRPCLPSETVPVPRAGPDRAQASRTPACAASSSTRSG